MSESDNIVQLRPLNTLADRYRTAYQRAENSRAEWIAATLEMAEVLYEARERFNNDAEFGHWVVDNGLGFHNHQDQAALINMQRHRAITEKVLRETTRTSYQLIWSEEIKSRFTSASKPPSMGSETPKSDDMPSTASILPLNPDQKTEKSEEPTLRPSYGLQNHSSRGPVKKPEKSRFLKLFDLTADDVLALCDPYPPRRQQILRRSLSDLYETRGIRTKQSKLLLERAVTVVKSGKAPVLSNVYELDIRMFFSHLPVAWKRLDINGMASNFDRLVAADERAAELGNVPMDRIFREITHVYETGKALVMVKPATQFPANSRITHEVKYCGEVIWPTEYTMDVCFEDLNMGWHLADHWLKSLEVGMPRKPNEVLVSIGHLIEDLRAANSIVGVTKIMSACMQAYAKRNQRKDKADFSDGVPPGVPR